MYILLLPCHDFFEAGSGEKQGSLKRGRRTPNERQEHERHPNISFVHRGWHLTESVTCERDTCIAMTRVIKRHI
jgi:hypothetical protein